MSVQKQSADYSALLKDPLLERLITRCTELMQHERRAPAEIALTLQREIPSDATLRNIALASVKKRMIVGNDTFWGSTALYSSELAEQATHPQISASHAQQFHNSDHLVEIGTGSGCDTAALAQRARRITSLELNPLNAALARFNLAQLGCAHVEILCEDASAFFSRTCPTSYDALWADPARRLNGTRISDPEKYLPPLSTVIQWAESKRAGIKISPGLNLKETPPGWVRQWIGFGDECREQVLWLGTNLHDGEAVKVDHDLHWRKTGAERASVYSGTLNQLTGHYLVEPHAALIRCGHLDSFYAEQQIELLDPKIAYGITTSGLPPQSPWYARFKIRKALPYQVKLLVQEIETLGWEGGLEIKKRGFDLSPEEVRSKLRLPVSGNIHHERVLILTRAGDDHVAILAEAERNI